MKVALHSLVFPHPKDILCPKVLIKIKEMGYHGIEIIPIDFNSEDIKKLKNLTDSIDLNTLIGWSLGPEHSLIDSNPELAKAGIAWMKELINMAVELDAKIIAGLNYAGCGCLSGKPHSEEELNRAVVAYRNISDYALKHSDVQLCLEPATREDSHLINTVVQGEAFISAVGNPNVKLLLDTFQMLREEGSIDSAIRTAADKIGHFHVSESHRGIPGTGTVPWKEVANALQQVDYDQWLCIEAFFDTNSFIASNAKVWRQLADNPFALAESAITFVYSTFNT